MLNLSKEKKLASFSAENQPGHYRKSNDPCQPIFYLYRYSRMAKEKLNLKIAELEGLICGKFPDAGLFMDKGPTTETYQRMNQIGEEFAALQSLAAELENALPAKELVSALKKTRAHAKLLVEIINVCLLEDLDGADAKQDAL